MEQFLQSLATFAPGDIIQWAIALATVALSCYILYSFKKTKLRFSNKRNEQDVAIGLLAGIIFGALTGLLWATWNPIMVAPPYIHLRVFSFFIPLIGLFFGPASGLVAGWVATMVWAPMAGAFNPLHSPFADGLFVGLTGWIPGMLLRGDKTNAELLEEISANTTKWLIRSGVVCLFTGLFMSFFVSISFQVLNIMPFWTSFWAIGVISDTAPMVLFTGIAFYGILLATRRTWSWLPRF